MPMPSYLEDDEDVLPSLEESGEERRKRERNFTPVKYRTNSPLGMPPVDAPEYIPGVTKEGWVKVPSSDAPDGWRIAKITSDSQAEFPFIHATGADEGRPPARQNADPSFSPQAPPAPKAFKADSISGIVPRSPSEPPVENPVEKTAREKNQAVADITGQKPGAPNPKWWQKLGAAAIGFGAGYSNAEGKARHIDSGPATDAIMGLPQYQQKLSDWNTKLEGAKAQSEAAESNRQAWWKNRNAETQEGYRAAQEKRLDAQDQRDASRSENDAAKIANTDAEKQDEVNLKGREDAFVLGDGEQTPPGWTTYTSAANPKNVYAIPPRFEKAPKELLPYLPGRKLGDVVSRSEIKQAQAAAQKDTVQQNKPMRPPAENVERILLNPGDYTPDQVKKAQQMFNETHRPPASAQNHDAVAEALERTAQALANGDLTRIRDIASLRGDQRVLLFDRAKQINPNFSTGDIDRKLKMEDYYANGKGAANLQSFGTFLEHGGAAVDAASALGRGNPALLNKPLNWIARNLTGDPTYQAFTVALEPVRKEFEKFLIGGGALYVDDRKEGKVLLNDDSSLGQVLTALKGMGHAATARLTEENHRYKKVMKRDLVDPVSEEAIEGARKMGIQVGGGATAPAGTVHFVDAGVSYDIPADKVRAFSAAHPNAKRGQ